MMDWTDIEKLGLWVINKYFGGNIDELRAETYLCYLHCKEHYQPEYSNFSTYYRTSLIGRIKDYLTYNSNLVHVPRMKQDTHLFPVSSLSTNVFDDDSSVCALDLLEDSGEAENDEEREIARWLSNIDDLYPKLNNSEKNAIPFFKKHITDGTPIPRNFRSQVWSIRQKLLDYIEK